MISPIQLTPDMDMGTLVNAVNNNFRQVEAENRTKVIKDEEGIDRVIMGRLPDSTYGIKVSKPGIGVLTADDNDLIFSSSNNLFKIVDSGSIPMEMPTVPAGQNRLVTAIVEHDLGYSPLTIAWLSYTNPQVPGSIQTRQFGSGSIGTRLVNSSTMNITYVSDETIDAGIDSITFTWNVSNALGMAEPPVSATLKYYILSETAA